MSCPPTVCRRFDPKWSQDTLGQATGWDLMPGPAALAEVRAPVPVPWLTEPV